MPTPAGKKHKEKKEKVKVKREPMEVKPLSEYVDDRLELIKQAFACLKPKAIKGVTPKLLQKDSLEVIQEKCLDEILGISKKRLLSIINDTKCPSDTESSDDDVENIVECISLDEISSDDDTKAKSKPTAKRASNGDKKKPVQPIQVKEEKPPPVATGEKKEYSVLELLELQARARAIRSQLAQEPVTKIELDDDDDEPAGKEPEKAPKSVHEAPKKPVQELLKKSVPESPKKKDKKSDKKSSSGSSKPESIKVKFSNGNSSHSSSSSSKLDKNIRVTITAPTTEGTSPSKSVKIVRTFRKHETSPEIETPKSVDVKKEELVKEKSSQDRSRDSSPDVMQIMASPVTLCISSSDEEGEPVKTTNVVEVQKEKSPPKEVVKEIEPAKTPEPPEEGELEDDPVSPPAQVEEEQTTTTEEVSKPQAVEEDEKVPEPTETPTTEQTPADGSSQSLDQSKDDADVLCVQLDDDCIDLEYHIGTDDEEEEAPVKEVAAKPVEEETVEIVDSSADEDVDDGEKDSASSDSKSWGERWLESSKVTKILATSKLSNQMRRNIQLNKKKKLKDAEDALVEAVGQPTDQGKSPLQPEPQYTAAEVGSLEHYKKIVDEANARAE